MTPVNFQQAFKTSSQCQCIRSEGTLGIKGPSRFKVKFSFGRQRVCEPRFSRCTSTVRMARCDSSCWARAGASGSAGLGRAQHRRFPKVPRDGGGEGGVRGRRLGSDSVPSGPAPGSGSFVSPRTEAGGEGRGGGRAFSFLCPPAPPIPPEPGSFVSLRQWANRERGAEHALLKAEQCLGAVSLFAASGQVSVSLLGLLTLRPPEARRWALGRLAAETGALGTWALQGLVIVTITTTGLLASDPQAAEAPG